MKKMIFVVAALLVAASVHAQTTVAPEAVQQQLAKARPYTLVFYVKGTKEVKQTEAEAQHTQMLHLQYLFGLKESNVLSVFGPLTDGSTVQGILIFNTTDSNEVKKYLDQDPHVKSGHLAYEIHPWFGVPGQALAEK